MSPMEFHWRSEKQRAEAYARYIRNYGEENWARLNQIANDRAHFGSLAAAERTFHIEMMNLPEGSGSAYREFYDEGLSLVGNARAAGIEVSGGKVADVLKRVKYFETFHGDWGGLCALKLRLDLAGKTAVEARTYLRLSERELEFLVDEVGFTVRPKSNYWRVPLGRKRAPRKGWAARLIKVRKLKMAATPAVPTV